MASNQLARGGHWLPRFLCRVKVSLIGLIVLERVNLIDLSSAYTLIVPVTVVL